MASPVTVFYSLWVVVNDLYTITRSARVAVWRRKCKKGDGSSGYWFPAWCFPSWSSSSPLQQETILCFLSVVSHDPWRHMENVCVLLNFSLGPFACVCNYCGNLGLDEREKSGFGLILNGQSEAVIAVDLWTWKAFWVLRRGVHLSVNRL